MFVHTKSIRKDELRKGVLVQELGQGTSMNVLHWNMADGSEVPLHEHVQEQFGYVIKGGFDILIGEERSVLSAGDAYFIPPNVKHSFRAIGETEAIDVFNPIKTDFEWKS
jgi:quercetin dioxygenase-like cupin family protein